MRPETPIVISLPDVTIQALNAIGDANRKAGSGPTGRSSVIRYAIDRLLTEGRSTPAKPTFGRARSHTR